MRTSRNTNHYLYDVSFALYYTQILFTNTTSQTNHDIDGLYPEDRALLQIHKKLKESSMCRYPIANREECSDWHKHCVVKVSFQAEASLLWKINFQYYLWIVCARV